MLHENTTLLNPQVALAFRMKGASGVTEANPIAQRTARSFRPMAGTLLCDSYRVVKELSKGTGEADLYLCEKEGESFVAKLYRREQAVKREVLAELQAVDCPFVAKLYEIGKYKGFPLEILPYYPQGSLTDKTFTWEEIKNDILPCLNEALHALHEKRILHKDIKPSNIMKLSDNGVALIDFGISSVIGEGSTVLMTKTGMTPEYAAPETFRGVYLEESDYYSLGITLYELFAGHTPYRHMAPEVITQYMALQRIPYPEEMPEELQNLIGALTYHDLTARNERENPNRRWTYEEVKLFLEGEKLPFPGKGMGGLLSDEIEPYSFMGNTYTTLSALVNALGSHWNEGKKELFRGKLSHHFLKSRPVLSRYCYEAEEEGVKRVKKDDILFWKLLYRLYPELKTVFWRGRAYPTLSSLGREMLEKLWASNKKDAPFWESILREGLLSAYLSRLVRPKEELSEAVRALESAAVMGDDSEEGREMRYYLTAYLLSGQKLLYLDGHEFGTPQELSDYMQKLFEKGYDRLKAFCAKLVNDSLTLRVPLAAWLTVHGKTDAMERHRAILSQN